MIFLLFYYSTLRVVAIFKAELFMNLTYLHNLNEFMRTLFLLLPLWLFISCQQTYGSSDDYKLIITLKNAPFDSLYLYEATDTRKIVIPCKKKENFTWEVIIPDSIVSNSKSMKLRVSEYDFISKSRRAVRFIAEVDGKRNIVGDIGIEDKINYIYGVYMGQSIFPNEDLEVRIGSKDSLLTGDIIDEDFKLILKNDSSDITVRAHDPFFSWFTDLNEENLSYNEYIARYVELSKTYPGSRYLMCYLSRMLSEYKSKKDVENIYNNFSEKHKNSIWAKKIERFLYSKFANVSLPRSDKKTYEKIIQDSSKYNLITFSASWCGPCIKEIPVLKKINKDLDKKLILTYISIDKKESVESFEKIMQEEDIPWRALFAYEDIQGIKEKYFIDGIPHSILVSPNGDMEIIEIRDEQELERLYLLCREEQKISHD